MAGTAATGAHGAGDTRWLAAVVESSDDAIITKDQDAIITSWNPGAERIYGYSAREAIGRAITMLVPPHRAGEERRILDRIMAGDRVDHYETERLTKDGRMISVSISVSPVTTPEGETIGASVIARDITARQRLQRAQRFLAQAGALLDRSLDPHETLQIVTRLVVPDLGELAVIDLLGEDGGIEGAVVAASKDPADGAALERLRREFPVDPRGAHPVARVLRTGRSELLPELSEETLKEIAQGEDHLEFMRRLRYRSALVAPLEARGRTLGALSILRLGNGPPYESEDLILAEELARRAALALDNARLYAQLSRMRESDRFLSEASKLLSTSLGYQETLRRVAELAIPGFADWCVVDVVDQRGELERVALAHRDAERVALALEIERRYPRPPDEDTGPSHVVRTGQSEIYPVITDELLTAGADDEEHLAALRQLGMESAMVVPMVAWQRNLGAITLVSSTPGRHFDVQDLSVAEELGRRAGVAVENARLYSERSRVAQTLQASLLPRALPHIPGIELASRFRPAGDGLEVGGDFYDVFPTAHGRWMAVIGDVCGKGAESAGLTALARYTLRSLAQTESGASEVLRRLNRTLVEEDLMERFLTVLVVSLEVADDRVALRLSAGGHPHPLRVLAGGEVDVVEVPGPLVGVFPDAEFEERELELGKGESLVLYTDGLTDAQAPDRVLSSQDLAMRLQVAGARSAQDVVAAAEGLAAGAGGAGPRDDIALLAVHVALDANGEPPSPTA